MDGGRIGVTMGAMRILVALGGNALLRRGEPADAGAQRRNVEPAAEGLAAIAADNELIISHGSGSQVGRLATQSESCHEVAPHPLDVRGAESAGTVGQMLGLALRNAMPDRDVVTVLTEVVVNPDDPEFRQPSKPIGPVYSLAEAEVLARERGWIVGRDGSSFRRLVPSPEPTAVAELRSLRVLIESGAVLICAGGGTPVTLDGAGKMRGVEAVIDEDLTAALLARRLDADLLLMLSDVEAIHLDWRTDRSRPLREASPAQLRALEFPAGSIGPKVEAACRFVEATGRQAAVGALADAERIVRGEAGTQVGSRVLTPRA